MPKSSVVNRYKHNYVALSYCSNLTIICVFVSVSELLSFSLCSFSSGLPFLASLPATGYGPRPPKLHSDICQHHPEPPLSFQPIPPLNPFHFTSLKSLQVSIHPFPGPFISFPASTTIFSALLFSAAVTLSHRHNHARFSCCYPVPRRHLS